MGLDADDVLELPLRLAASIESWRGRRKMSEAR
jgi:hypothetical protein